MVLNFDLERSCFKTMWFSGRDTRACTHSMPHSDLFCMGKISKPLLVCGWERKSHPLHKALFVGIYWQWPQLILSSSVLEIWEMWPEAPTYSTHIAFLLCSYKELDSAVRSISPRVNFHYKSTKWISSFKTWPNHFFFPTWNKGKGT